MVIGGALCYIRCRMELVTPDVGKEDTMVKWAGIAVIALCVLHMVVLGADIPAELPGWLSLNLWTFDHWQPLRAQPIDLALSGSVFWASIGSFAIPLAVLGALLLWMDRRGMPVPAFVGWALAGWMLLATLLMPPSGFPLGLAVMLVLAVGLVRRARRA